MLKETAFALRMVEKNYGKSEADVREGFRNTFCPPRLFPLDLFDTLRVFKAFYCHLPAYD